MKRLSMTLALTGMLCISALAGDMSTADSPKPKAGGTPQGMVPGDRPTGDVAPPEIDDALSALLSVLGLVL